MWKLDEWMKRGGVAVAGLVMATACAAQEPADRAEPAPIAEAVTEDGSLVQFFEPKPGAILITQDIAPGAKDVTNTAPSALALYQRLAPGQAIPVALVEAQARVEIARAGKRPIPTRKADTLSFANNDDFYEQFCSDDAWDVIHCALDHTGTYRITKSSTDYASCTASVDSGAVTFRLLVEGEVEFSRDLFAPDGKTFRKDSGLWNDEMTCEVINGVGDRYDAGYRFTIN
jgi:hypothetical protein